MIPLASLTRPSRVRVKDRRPRNAAPKASLTRARLGEGSIWRVRGTPAPEPLLSSHPTIASGTESAIRAITRQGVEKQIARQRGLLFGGRR
jgi:hypothetical protein